MGEIDDVSLVDFQSAVEVLDITLHGHGVALVGLVSHIAIEGAVLSLGVVDADAAGFIGDPHGAIGSVGDGLNGSLDNVELLGHLVGLQRQSQQLSDGQLRAVSRQLGRLFLDRLFVMDEVNDPCVLNFRGVALVVLQGAVDQNFIANNGLVLHSVETERTVSAGAAVNHDGAGFVLDGHLAVGLVINGLNDCADVETLSRGIFHIVFAQLQSLCDGDARKACPGISRINGLGGLSGVGGCSGGFGGCGSRISGCSRRFSGCGAGIGAGLGGRSLATGNHAKEHSENQQQQSNSLNHVFTSFQIFRRISAF